MSKPPADHARRKHGTAYAVPAQAAPLEDRLLTQRDAARLLGVSPSYLRASSCPTCLLPGNGPRGRPLLRYRLSDVVAWARGELEDSPTTRPRP